MDPREIGVRKGCTHGFRRNFELSVTRGRTPLAYSNLPGVQPRRCFSKVVQIKDSSNLYYFIYIKVSRQNSKI